MNRRGAVTVIELTKLLKTSESTIRRDLNALARIGKLNKGIEIFVLVMIIIFGYKMIKSTKVSF